MADADAHLEDSRRRVDELLAGRLPPESDPPESLHAAMRYAVFSGGKRLRPALAFGAAAACAAPLERALPIAGAVELVHAYSLVHDDLPAMDDDTERRGQPTVHVRYGQAIAILAGDALLAEAFGLLADSAAPPDVIARLAAASGSRALVGGQADDLDFADRSEVRSEVRFEELQSIHARKTGALFRVACWGGGRLAGGAETDCDRLDAFAREFGHAFQLADDLDDADPSECSALRLLSPEGVRTRAREHLEGALGALEHFGAGAGALRSLAERLAGRLA